MKTHFLAQFSSDQLYCVTVAHRTEYNYYSVYLEKNKSQLNSPNLGVYLFIRRGMASNADFDQRYKPEPTNMLCRQSGLGLLQFILLLLLLKLSCIIFCHQMTDTFLSGFAVCLC